MQGRDLTATYVTVLDSDLRIAFVSADVPPLTLADMLGQPCDWCASSEFDAETLRSNCLHVLRTGECRRYWCVCAGMTFLSSANRLPIGGVIVVSRVMPPAAQYLTTLDRDLMRGLAEGIGQAGLAHATGLSQPRVSRRLAALREMLGVTCDAGLIDLWIAIE